MRPTLPRAPGRFLLSLALLVACTRHADPPVAPAPPLPAEPEAKVGKMDEECNAFLAGLATWHDCPNLTNNEAAGIKATLEFAESSFAVGKKAELDEPSQHEIAIRCHRAA